MPESLNGVPFKPWTDAPDDVEGWDELTPDEIDEPLFVVGKSKYAASGVVIQEPDGRVWLVAPTNGYGGYRNTFPKGSAEAGLSLAGNAMKEAFEESGLQVEITGFLMDVERTTSKARFYTARRVGGTPAAMGWESQAVHLCPPDKLYELLNGIADHDIAEALGAGPKPVKKTEKNKPKSKNKGLFGQ